MPVPRGNNQKTLKVKEFDELLLSAIDDAFFSLGESVKKINLLSPRRKIWPKKKPNSKNANKVPECDRTDFWFRGKVS
jgi:hypothetical protein